MIVASPQKENFSNARLRLPPPTLARDYEKFMVNRCGRGHDAVQIIRAIIGTVDKEHTYRITLDGLFEISDGLFTTNPAVTHTPVRPKLAALIDAEWSSLEGAKQKHDNLLGRSCRLVVEDMELLRVPTAPASHEHLAFYGAELYQLGDTIKFRTPLKAMAVARAYIGQNYVSGYLLQPDLGGGAYLERHNQPHLHVPLNKDAAGHLILAKQVASGSFIMSAFRIPFGYAVYTRSNTLHCDSFLIGEYLAVFAVEDDYRTGIVMGRNGEILPVEVS